MVLVRESEYKKEEKGNSLFFFLSHWPDSNRRPTHYECVALPTEPQWQSRQNVLVAWTTLLASLGRPPFLLLTKTHEVLVSISRSTNQTSWVWFESGGIEHFNSAERDSVCEITERGCKSTAFLRNMHIFLRIWVFFCNFVGWSGMI